MMLETQRINWTKRKTIEDILNIIEGKLTLVNI